VKRDALTQPYVLTGDPDASLIATAIHAGHDLRPEVAAILTLDEDVRLREEDPFTDRIAACADAQAYVSRSRFEVDLNRGRDQAVYRTPDDSWGLEIWADELPTEVVEGSLEVYDAFYRDLGRHLDQLAQRGPFVVYDVHSYNYRRGGPEEPGDPEDETPDINVGTKSLSGEWRAVVDTFIGTLDGREVNARPLDVRENVRFKGANLSHWVAERYGGVGCTLALEFKKTFMDEWSGGVDESHLGELTAALGDSIPAVLDAVRSAAP